MSCDMLHVHSFSLLSCIECNDGESQLPILEFPVTDHSDSFESGHNAESSVTLLKRSLSRNSEKYEDGKLDVNVGTINVSTNASSTGSGTGTPASSTSGFGFSSPRKKTSEFNVGKSIFDKILNPSITQRPDFAPYRIVLGDVREKVCYSIDSVSCLQRICSFCQISWGI